MGEDVTSMDVTIEETIIGEWWLLGATFMALYQYPAPGPTAILGTGKLSGRGGVSWEATIKRLDQEMGTIALIEAGLSTRVRIKTAAEFEYYWQKILIELRNAAEFALRIRYFAGTDPIEAAIRLYYDRREKGEKITLRQLADQTGLSYDYLRKRKSHYDKQQRRLSDK